MAIPDSMELLHCIDPDNLAALQKTRMLRSAYSLMNAAEKKRHGKTKRGSCVLLANGIVLRDQQPLKTNTAFKDGAFKDGEEFPEYIKYINRHVFFWPKKIPGGFCNKYSHHIILRCGLGDLKKANPKSEILFSPYNSGATPPQPAKYPRARFEPVDSHGGGPLKEIIVYCHAALPPNTEYKTGDGKWHPLFRQKSHA